MHQPSSNSRPNESPHSMPKVLNFSCALLVAAFGAPGHRRRRGIRRVLRHPQPQGRRCTWHACPRCAQEGLRPGRPGARQRGGRGPTGADGQSCGAVLGARFAGRNNVSTKSWHKTGVFRDGNTWWRRTSDFLLPSFAQACLAQCKSPCNAPAQLFRR